MSDAVLEMRNLTIQLAAAIERMEDRSAGTQDPDAPLDDRALNALALTLIEQRKRRRRSLPAELFHEPAWDMLLALYVARSDPRPMNVKTLVGTADAPVTTSQRWVEHLHKLRLIDRVVDPADRRRIEVSLSQSGEDAMRRYLLDIARL